ncbi:hypothetical protein REPUB_Repub08aG0075600 [Reevesia pubescens]
MANLGDRRRPDNRIAEKLVPASDWTQDAKANYLFVDLPGFKKEQLRLEIASTGHIIISGERIVNDQNKCICFKQTFAVPENSDMDNISAKFDGDFLHITVPRKSVVEENKQDESMNENYANSIGETSVQEEPNNHGEDQSKHEERHGDHEQHHGNEVKGEKISKETYGVASFPEEMVKKWEQEDDGPLEMAMKFLKKNKGVVLSVVIAFSIGVLVCRTFESSTGE